MVDPLPSTNITYQWNTTGCYKYNNGRQECFPQNLTTQNVTDNDLTAEDAGIVTCSVTIDGIDYSSEPFTLRISGMILYTCK